MATCPTCRNDYEASTFCPRDGTRLVGGETAPVLGGRYRLLRKVGEGGMGEVYEAEHVFIRRRVAVKILKREIASDPQAIERLQREAQSTSGLRHPNIVETTDFGYSDEHQVYLVMEWLDGENLEQRLGRGPVDLATALDIAAQAAAGLADAHEQGVIHRDLKPANLFLIRDRHGRLVVKVLDFGIAKLAMRQTQLTGTGVLVGTPNYMAPEQALGDAVDARTDVYSLGVILYEMVTGSVPFHADSPIAVLHQHTARIPALPSVCAPERGISPELETLIMDCLAKRPDERPATMHDVARSLVELAAPGARASAPTPERVQSGHDRGPARRRWISWGIGVGVLLLGTAVWYVTHRPSRRIEKGIVDAGVIIADAAPTPVDANRVSPDAASGPEWRGHGAQFAYTARASVAPRAGSSFSLTITLHDLSPALRHALDDGDLVLALELLYYNDHSVVAASTHVLDASSQIVEALSLPSAGNHHVHLELRHDGRVVDRATFDLMAEP